MELGPDCAGQPIWRLKAQVEIICRQPCCGPKMTTRALCLPLRMSTECPAKFIENGLRTYWKANRRKLRHAPASLRRPSSEENCGLDWFALFD